MYLNMRSSKKYLCFLMNHFRSCNIFTLLSSWLACAFNVSIENWNGLGETEHKTWVCLLFVQHPGFCFLGSRSCLTHFHVRNHDIQGSDMWCCGRLCATKPGCGCAVCDHRDDSLGLGFVSWYKVTVYLLQYLVIHFRNLGGKFYFQEP